MYISAFIPLDCAGGLRQKTSQAWQTPLPLENQLLENCGKERQTREAALREREEKLAQKLKKLQEEESKLRKRLSQCWRDLEANLEVAPDTRHS